MFVFVLLCITLCPFEFCNHLEEEESAGCFAFVVLRMSCYCKCSVTLLTVPWVGLQCVIMVFSDHTHLLFGRRSRKSIFKIATILDVVDYIILANLVVLLCVKNPNKLSQF